MMFFNAAERSGKLQHLSRIFLTSVLIIAAVAAVFALCARVSDIGTAPIYLHRQEISALKLPKLSAQIFRMRFPNI